MSTLVGLLSPLTANAAPIADGKDPNWLAASYWYYNAVLQCTGRTGGWNIGNESSVTSGAWFGSGGLDYHTGSYFARSFMPDIGDDGKAGCNANDNELLKRAFAHWGINPVNAICESDMAVRRGGVDCVQGVGNAFQWKNPGSNNKNLLETYLRNVIYGGQAPQLGGAAAYVYYRDTLLGGCAFGAQPLTTKPSGNNVYVVPTFQKDGDTVKTTETYYIGTKSPTSGVWTMTNPDADRNCGQLADLIRPGGAYASAYSRLVESGTIVDSPPGSCTGDDCPGEDESTTCAITGIGWIVCPVSYAMAAMAEFGFGIIANLLRVPPLLTTPNKGLFNAWETMRNIANVVFVGVFLIIIYSQMVGGGKR